MKEEKIIDKDCSGGDKLKAEKGLQTNFTKGGEWKIIKDLKGYPKHSQGGVDLSFEGNKVNFTRKDGKIHAKYGLVIANKKYCK